MGVLNLDKKKIEYIRSLAREVALGVQEFIDVHTTVSVERATLRMMGIDGVDSEDVPYPNVLVEHLRPVIENGAALYVVNAAIHTGKSPQQIAEDVAAGKLDLTKLPMAERSLIEQKGRELVEPYVRRILDNKQIREQRLSESPHPDRPIFYVIVATGNIYEDIDQARSAAKLGADSIAVIRTTGQSLLDFMPYGPTTEGFGGTYATQENFRIMREALDDVGNELGRYIRLVNYASGLCMPEIAVAGALERLDMLLNDSMYGIIFRDINMYRTFIDQSFSRMLEALAGIAINTGEDNYLTTSDAVEKGYTVLASDFINEQFAYLCGLTPELMGLGHAFEINPDIENSFLLELAQAYLIRECFPDHFLKYMPPTKHMTGNIFRTYMVNAMFNLAGIMTKQGIQLLGMLTEALHTPHLHDRYLALENAQYVMNAAKDLSDQFVLKEDSFIRRRAQTVLDETEAFMKELVEIGLIEAIERGMFADISRKRTAGKGRGGVQKKSPDYYNPMYDVFKEHIPNVHLPK